MKSQSSSAKIQFASPEIKVGLDAARGNKKKKAEPSMEGEMMPKNKKAIMADAPDPVAKKKMPNPAKKLPKRRK